MTIKFVEPIGRAWARAGVGATGCGAGRGGGAGGRATGRGAGAGETEGLRTGAGGRAWLSSARVSGETDTKRTPRSLSSCRC